MKKFLFSAILLVFAVAINAQPYHHSLGINLGSSNGISYKGYVRSLEHLVVQCDINYQICYTPEGACWGQWAASHSSQYFNSNAAGITDVYTSDASSYQAVVANANLMYQAVATSGQTGTLNWFIGGGIDVGGLWGGMYSDFTSGPWLKIGEHVMTGIEYCFAKAPVILGLDLRPGMATAMHFNVGNHGASAITNLFFDWGANVSVRFRLGK